MIDKSRRNTVNEPVKQSKPTMVDKHTRVDADRDSGNHFFLSLFPPPPPLPHPLFFPFKMCTCVYIADTCQQSTRPLCKL